MGKFDFTIFKLSLVFLRQLSDFLDSPLYRKHVNCFMSHTAEGEPGDGKVSENCQCD